MRDPKGREIIDENVRSIKMKIPPFQRKDNADVYLEWKRRIEVMSKSRKI